MSADFWVLVSFAGLAALLVYLRVPQRVLAGLDARGRAIREELEEARSLRAEALKILEAQEKKLRASKVEAEAIVREGLEEAERRAAEERRKTEELLARREEMADQRIAQAGRAAVRRIETETAALAVRAARIILSGEEAEQAKSVARAIEEIESRFDAGGLDVARRD